MCVQVIDEKSNGIMIRQFHKVVYIHYESNLENQSRSSSDVFRY